MFFMIFKEEVDYFFVSRMAGFRKSIDANLLDNLSKSKPLASKLQLLAELTLNSFLV